MFKKSGTDVVRKSIELQGCQNECTFYRTKIHNASTNGHLIRMLFRNSAKAGLTGINE